MKFTCDECYQLRQENTDKCPLCGKNTLASRVIGCSNLVKCSNCGTQAVSAGGFFEACHEDEREYLLRVYEPGDSQRFVKLAKIINRNVLDLKSQFENGQIDLKFKVMDCLEKRNAVMDANINCELDAEIEKAFPRIMDCPYAKGTYDVWTGFNEEVGIKYSSMFEWFTDLFPDDKEWFDNKCKEMDAYAEDGMHIVFEMVVVPYILDVAFGDKEKMKLVFDFIERMEVFGTTQIAEVIEFSVLENLIDIAKDKLDACVSYMGTETKEVFKTLGYKDDV